MTVDMLTYQRAMAVADAGMCAFRHMSQDGSKSRPVGPWLVDVLSVVDFLERNGVTDEQPITDQLKCGYQSQALALAAIYEALPDSLRPSLPDFGVMLPVSPARDWLAARDAFDGPSKHAWEKREQYFAASKALDTALWAALSGTGTSKDKLVPLSSVESAFRSWVTTANQNLKAGLGEMNHEVDEVSINPDKAWAVVSHILSGGEQS